MHRSFTKAWQNHAEESEAQERSACREWKGLAASECNDLLRKVFREHNEHPLLLQKMAAVNMHAFLVGLDMLLEDDLSSDALILCQVRMLLCHVVQRDTAVNLRTRMTFPESP